MLQYLGTITQPAGETGEFEGVESSFVLQKSIDCRELWADDDFEMIAVEVKGRDPKFTGEILGICSAPNEDMRVVERLTARTGYAETSSKRSIIGGELNLHCADWNGKAG